MDESTKYPTLTLETAVSHQHSTSFDPLTLKKYFFKSDLQMIPTGRYVKSKNASTCHSGLRELVMYFDV